MKNDPPASNNERLVTEELFDHRCRCGSSVRLVFSKDHLSWEVICPQGHGGEAATLPSDALAKWSLKRKRK
ncbi:MAG: hypothetical protein HN560_12595 [Anaerolineae bacterium]|jgi:hypothetical protein|nr:hypothetical protein [Anaerolineae bacterium]MBT6813908.1 hypothetical protein [Anaerolineae bacterium]MBT7601900.1 hypothetical protein [Anaerolineae bacterium]